MPNYMIQPDEENPGRFEVCMRATEDYPGDMVGCDLSAEEARSCLELVAGIEDPAVAAAKVIELTGRDWYLTCGEV